MEQLSPLNLFLKRTYRRIMQLLVHAASNVTFRHVYGLLGIVVLVASSVWWAALGAHVQQYNADQLSDPYMFNGNGTFHGASFPSAHTFLLKWPLFWLLGTTGVTATGLLAATVGVVLVTVLALAALLYAIERRPLVLGTYYLGLALMLLLVPAQPYAGGLLPVNMAMLTTRNIEYVLYMASLILFICAKRLRSWWFAAGVAALALLIASDKLFVAFGIGGASIALVVYSLLRNWRMVQFAARWLLGSIAAWLCGTGLILLLGVMRIAHFSTGSTVSPYAAGGSIKDIVLGLCYGVLGIFTNLGANPVPDNRTLGSLPHQVLASAGSVTTPLHVGALLLAGVGGYALWRTLKASWRSTSPAGATQTPVATQFALALVWSSVAAGGVFVGTQHYYPVDARYLTIVFFAVAVNVAVAFRGRAIKRPKWLVASGVALLVLVAGASSLAGTHAEQQRAAYATMEHRNELVSETLQRHKVTVLVGDYWRVLPIKFISHGQQNAQPMSGCTTPATTLTSSTWNPDLRRHSFAYLLTLDHSLTNYPSCSLAEVTAAYGRPNATQVIAGSITQPKEVLLFYDDGSHPPVSPAAPHHAAAPLSLLPVNLDRLNKTTCMAPTVMNFVAHEDDDLLFMNPDLLHELHADECVRTVYLTAGDAGQDKLYWLGRQLGAEAAYSTMLGIANIWDHQTVRVAADEFLTIATPRGNQHVSLIFLNVPDGDIHGDGFPASGNESLAKLLDGKVTALHSVDNQSSYTHDQLVQALAQLMNAYQPSEIHTQASVPSATYPDHSDHIATGAFTQLAADLYAQEHFNDVIAIPVVRYIGYPVHGYAGNVDGLDLAQKEAAFFAYAQHDDSVCGSPDQCAQVPTYNAYLSRQYRDE